VNSLIRNPKTSESRSRSCSAKNPTSSFQVADAKSLRRTILITSELVELGVPMILVLNMMDEAEERGVDIDTTGLSTFSRFRLCRRWRSILRAGGSCSMHPECRTSQGPMEKCGQWRPDRPDIGRDPGLAPFLTVEWLDLGDPDLNRALENALGSPASR